MKKQHYFLVTGNVIYQPLSTLNEPENQMGIMSLNSIVENQEMNFPVSSIAKAQQGIQHHFYKKTEDNTLKIIDVIITNICYLGQMTSEEFHASPVGTTEEKVTLQ